jgi:hypothetical protein
MDMVHNFVKLLKAKKDFIAIDFWTIFHVRHEKIIDAILKTPQMVTTTTTIIHLFTHDAKNDSLCKLAI